MQEYIKTDQQLHWMCQTIAKANRTYVLSQEDDSHTNLYFDSIGNRIVGQWIETAPEKRILSLNLSNLHFELLNASLQSILSISSIGKNFRRIEAELADGMKALGIDTKGFLEKLHYKIPSYPFAKEAIQNIKSANLEEWKHYRHLANEACSMVLEHLQAPGEIRIWPHHFDTGIYVKPNEKIGIGFGLAMEDPLADSPYFYVSGYASSGKINYADVDELDTGRWEVDGEWKGAIITLSEIKDLPSTEQLKSIMAFSKKVLDWFLSR